MDGIEGVAWDVEIAEAIQQAPSDVLEAAEELDGGGLIGLGEMLEQAAHFEQLQKDVSDLQQVVESLHIVRVDAVGMLQVQAAVFLDVEALILDL